MIDPVPVFPTVAWKREDATFVPAEVPLCDPEISQPAALVFPFLEANVVLADIITRGWCIPSGHIEPGETVEAAVRREALEEAGVLLGQILYIGYFVLTDRTTGMARHAPTFIGSVVDLTEIPPGHESRGRRIVGINEVAAVYFSWDPLLESVFQWAWRRRDALTDSPTVSPS